MCKRTITSEFVSYGHPDKMADQVSDAILDEFLRQDPNARTGIETMVKDNIVVLGGEVNSTADINYDKVVRETFKSFPFPPSHHLSPSEIKVVNLIGKQSPEINQGVDKDNGIIGAGDQGFVVGYASNESPVYMPLGHYLAKLICQHVALLTPVYGPDTKSQVTVEYDTEEGTAKVKHILVSTMHQCLLETCRKRVEEMILNNDIGIPDEIFKKYIFGQDIEILVNPCGEWKTGGPVADCGVTGRKIVVDAYGGYCNVGGGAYCVDGDTEYIGEDLKWHKIKDYQSGKVGQWNNGILEFVTPIKYHANKSEKMYHFHNEKTIDMVLSENHDIVCKTSKNNIHKVKAKDVIDKINNNVDGFKDMLPCTFEYYGGNGVDLTDDQIRLQVAFCADGTYSSIAGKKGRINIKKKNKIERLEWLLKRTNTEYKLLDKGEFHNHYYTFVPPVPNNKSLYNIFKDADYRQLAIVANEVLQWDGCEKRGVFRTTIKEDADFIQFVFSVIFNKRVTIITDDRVGCKRYDKELDKEYQIKSKLYQVIIGKYKEISLCKNNKCDGVEITPFETDMMYCFTVDSGMLLLRRNDKIFVTGNCGKDHSKVDRSAAYMARYLAKNIVATGICNNAKVELSYAISVPYPTAINVELDTNREYEEKIIAWMRGWIDLTPCGIYTRFNGSYPRYHHIARYGNYGYDVSNNEELGNLYPWERLDLAGSLKLFLGL